MTDLKNYRTSCLVVGSGCAGLNAADTLFSEGVTDVILATEGMNMGTSRNTGSDKQTYYKLAISSDCTDSVGQMAESYFACGAMSGELALTESANSLKCFFKLQSLGVPFPQNDFGEFLGYKTDHDNTKRATSAGPLTSKYMTEVLEKSVLAKNIHILDSTTVFKLFKKDNKICGALCYDNENKEFVLIETPNIILATGGSAALYRDSVFPHSQTGMSGLAIEIGARTVNLTEWQYGLASVDFRWNVSGTYQQVLPRYISVDNDGTEYEFLSEHLSREDVLLYTFRKGYQWPFDSRKMEASSIIDCLVHAEILKGRKVYMDFMQNPKSFDINSLPDEAREYLENSGAMQDTPIERLLAMNVRAYELYKNNGIDLKVDKLRVAVCAQHQNGGLFVDKNYQTNIEGLYAAGEVAGVFGIYRPGGSALNSTQVSSMRAAKHIAKKENFEIPDIKEYAEDFISALNFTDSDDMSFKVTLKNLQKSMSDYAAFSRSPEEISRLVSYTEKLICKEKYNPVPKNAVLAYLKYRDTLITMHEVLLAMELWCREVGSRGGAYCVGSDRTDTKALAVFTENGTAYLEEQPPIPKSEVWFEKVYNTQ